MKIFRYIQLLALAPLVFAGLTGCEDKDEFPVPPASTVARFSYEMTSSDFAPASVQFSNESIVPEHAAPATYVWSFGDGTVSEEENPLHTFTAPGKYTVTLVTASQKQIAEYSTSITVKDPSAVGRQLLFTDRNTGTIQNILINNQEPVNAAFIPNAFNRPYYLLADTTNNRLFISDFAAGSISYTSLDGDAPQSLVEGLDGPGQLAMDRENNMLYWTTATKIQRVSIADIASPGGVEDVVTGQADDPEGLAYHAASNTLFWSTYDGGLWKKDLNSGSESEIIPAVYGQALQVIEDQLFYYGYDGGNYSLFKANLDGGNTSLIASGMNGDVYGIAYNPDDQKVYWSDQRNGIIWRSTLNGTEKEAWFTDPGMRIYSVIIGKKIQ